MEYAILPYLIKRLKNRMGTGKHYPIRQNKVNRVTRFFLTHRRKLPYCLLIGLVDYPLSRALAPFFNKMGTKSTVPIIKHYCLSSSHTSLSISQCPKIPKKIARQQLFYGVSAALTSIISATLNSAALCMAFKNAETISFVLSPINNRTLLALRCNRRTLACSGRRRTCVLPHDDPIRFRTHRTCIP